MDHGETQQPKRAAARPDNTGSIPKRSDPTDPRTERPAAAARQRPAGSSAKTGSKKSTGGSGARAAGARTNQGAAGRTSKRVPAVQPVPGLPGGTGSSTVPSSATTAQLPAPTVETASVGDHGTTTNIAATTATAVAVVDSPPSLSAPAEALPAPVIAPVEPSPAVARRADPGEVAPASRPAGRTAPRRRHGLPSAPPGPGLPAPGADPGLPTHAPTELMPPAPAPDGPGVLERTPSADATDGTGGLPALHEPLRPQRQLRAPAVVPRARRPRVRKVTRVIRHVDTWSVFKVAVVFNVFCYTVCLVAGVLLWQVAQNTGTVDNVERFLENFGWESFELKGGEIYHNAWIAGLFVCVGGTGLAVLVATLFNLITDLVGGIRVTVLEEEVIAREERTSGWRRARRRPIGRDAAPPDEPLGEGVHPKWPAGAGWPAAEADAQPG